METFNMKNLSNAILFSLIVTLPATVTATHESEQEIAKRTAPVGKVYRAGDTIKQPQKQLVAVEVAAAEPRSGSAIYTAKCAMCHDTGAANAPKLGNITDWEPRIANGFDSLLASAINGTSAGMPPKGMCMDCSDDELKATVEYMVENSK